MNKKMLNIYFDNVLWEKVISREAEMIRQGLSHFKENTLNKTNANYFIILNNIKSQEFPKEKTIHIDFRDSYMQNYYDNEFLYFKRSCYSPIRSNGTRRLIPKNSIFLPITYGVMDQYIFNNDLKKDIILGCYLRIYGFWNKSRKKVYDIISQLNIKGSYMGAVDKQKRATFSDKYFNYLRRSQIIVTCNPSTWEGDMRTWEALAQGGLVFIDRIYQPIDNPLVDGVHCIFYDVTDNGLKIMADKIKYYIEHPLEAKKIGEKGRNFVLSHHRSKHRMEMIINAIYNKHENANIK